MKKLIKPPKFVKNFVYRRRIKKHKKLTPEQLPDAMAKWYSARTGEVIDWNNLQGFSQKIQWIKIHDITDLKTQCADKYRVREYVENVVGKQYLIPLIGVWEKPEDIDFDALPQSFVLKMNNSSGENIIVRDKSTFDPKKAIKKLRKWMRSEFAYLALEFHYAKIKPLIIAEQYMENNKNDLMDYKFMCFDGLVKDCRIDVDRWSNHKRLVFDAEGNVIPAKYGTPDSVGLENYQLPENFKEMVEVSSKLSKGFKVVRVDLYNVDGKIYFGEMTFTPASGVEKITPREYALELGDLIKI